MTRLLSILLFSIFLFSGCTQPIDDRTIVTVWTLQMGDFAPYMNSVIAEYEATHKNIKINWVDVPFSEGEKRTLAVVLGDTPPDLINLNPDFSALLAQRGALEKIPSKYVDDFSSQIIDSLKYEGVLYSIPWYATSSVTFVNKDLLKKTEIGKTEPAVKKVRKWVSAYRFKLVDMKYDKVVNEIPLSYTQMNNYAVSVKKMSGAYIYTPNLVENDTMLRILNKYGVNSPETINSEWAVRLLEQYRELYQNGALPPETIAITHREALEQYMAGKSVFFQAGANFLNMLKENSPEVYKATMVKPQLMGSKGMYDFALMNFVIPVKAKNKKEALEFCLFLTNSENQLKLAKLTNVIATNNVALGSGFYNDYSTLQGQARSISAKQLHKLLPVRQTKNQKELNYLVNTAVQKILTSKENKTQEILDKLAEDWALLITK